MAVSLQSAFIVKNITYKESERTQRLTHINSFIALVAILCVGEFTALKAVYTGSSDKSDLIIIYVALVLPTLFIAVEFVLVLLNRIKDFWYVTYMLLGLGDALLLPFI